MISSPPCASIRNDDGGFGALESDFGSDASSVLNTTHALQILSQIGLDVLHDLVASSMQYLLATYDPAITGWPIPIEQLRYWSVEHQEAYVDAAAANQRRADARTQDMGKS